MQSISYDIAPSATSSTMIRFATSTNLSSRDYLYIDDLQIEYMATSSGNNGDPPPMVSTTSVGDDFNAVAYDNNDGLINWDNNWIEHDVSSSGPAQGLVSITMVNSPYTMARVRTPVSPARQTSLAQFKPHSASITAPVPEQRHRLIGAP